MKAIATLLLAPLLFASSQEGSKDAEAIQGPWRIVVYITKGNKVPAEELEKVKVVISEDRIIYRAENKKDMFFKFRLDPSKSPRAIEWMEPKFKDKGDTKPELVFDALPGIYQLEGDRLKICVGTARRPEKDAKGTVTDPGSAAERPKTFTAGTRTVLIILERVK